MGVCSGISYQTEIPVLMVRIYLILFMGAVHLFALAVFGLSGAFPALIFVLASYGLVADCMPVRYAAPKNYESRIRATAYCDEDFDTPAPG